MAIQNSTTSFLCLNTGIDGHKPSTAEKKKARAKLKEEFSDVSIVFWSELQNPLFGSLREVTNYLDPDSWKGLASVSFVSSTKESRNDEYRWETTKQDILLMWKDSVWEEVLPDSPTICNVLETRTVHQTKKMNTVSTRFHYPAGFPSKRVAWTILKRTGENFDYRLVAFVAFHGIQYDASKDEKKHDIREVFDFFHKKICKDMNISVVIGGDFNAAPKDINNWTKDLNIDIECILPEEEGKIINTTRQNCLDHIWILHPDITKDPSMHAISIEKEVMSVFREPPYHLKHAPFRANMLFLDMIHPGRNCDHIDVQEFKNHLSEFFLQESVSKVSAQRSTQDKFMFHVVDPTEMADLIVERMKHSANELSVCNKCKQGAHRGTLENANVSENCASPSKVIKRKKISRNDVLARTSNCNTHHDYLYDTATERQMHQEPLEKVLLKKVVFETCETVPETWKEALISELLKFLTTEEQGILKWLLQQAFDIICDFKRNAVQSKWRIIVPKTDERLYLIEFLQEQLKTYQQST
ncbi:hypothetical protein M9435_007016 [Picochlorum sp. BPE23]|nr:hypothetical protein M9435_007016 [Picochlorum sp. BPE23]